VIIVETKLTGEGAKMLRGEFPIKDTIPTMRLTVEPTRQEISSDCHQ
jgi:hypothetical protein